MAKDIFYYVRCKKNPESALQHWVPQMSVIYSKCQACGASTGYAQEGTAHYDRFEIIIHREPREKYEDFVDRADAMIRQNPEAYQVEEHSDRMQACGKAAKTKCK